MNKISIIFTSLFVLNLGQALAAPLPLMPANYVEIEHGNLAENTLLANDEGDIFIEFSKDTKFVNAEEKLNFTGEILPPQKIEFDLSKPRGMMRELITFEMVSNTGADIAFIDRYDQRSRKNILREEILNPEGLERSSWVKFVYPIENSLVSMPKLWEWQGEEDGWKRIGGGLSDVEDSAEELRILSAILRRTGIYTVFDENPAPEHFADEYEIHPPNYTPPVILEEIYDDNEDIDISQYSEYEDNNLAEFHQSSPEDIYPDEIPSISETKSAQILQELKNTLAENPAKLVGNLSMQSKVNELSSILAEKIKNEEKVEQVNKELNNISFSLANAGSPEERDNLENAFLELQTNLYKLQKTYSTEEDKFISLKKEVDDFFAGISMGETTNIDQINQTPKENIEEDELYIPGNAQLTQSGGEESSQNISWKFPVFLLICLSLLGWGIFSTKKKSY